ncbi:hypothetical protein BDN72DRAFT_879467 [Pluteus cervinus]|uniref:Uncharacterized protein n=1 Tax=Pluteus cervinus TaxID=181527 RepID=A0ACD3AP93_9AGAR|nr:hypothetical protein BDN72DRAFT_879467 [Pluteus cervinus]
MPISTQSSDRLSCLPDELLSEILEDLDDLDLYHFIFTCRILHHYALNVLFQRHCFFRGPPNCPGYALSIDTNPKPPFLFSALYGALFVNGSQCFDIGFNCATFSRLLEGIRGLTALIGRSPGPYTIYLTFAGTAHLNLPPSSDAHLQAAVQSLVETILIKGCRSLSIREGTESWEASSLDQSEDGEEEEPRRGGSMHRLLHPFINLFKATRSTKSEQIKLEEPTPWMKDDKEDSDPVDLPVRRRSDGKGWNYKFVPSATLREDLNNNLGFVLSLSGDMLFRPLWLNWTLNFLNSNLSFLILYTDHIARDILYDILPNIYLPAIEIFMLYDKTISFDALGVFLRRHSSTLVDISLEIDRPDTSQLVGSSNGIFAKSAFDFPKVEWLTLNPSCVEWFFKGILAFSLNATMRGIRSKLSGPGSHTHLPSTRSIGFSNVHARSKQSNFFSQLDGTLPTLAKLSQSASRHATDRSSLSTTSSPTGSTEPQGQAGSRWFSVIALCTQNVDEQSHIEWFESHVSQGATSPLTALHTVSELVLVLTTLSPRGLRALAKFLALFKGLKKATLTRQSTKVLKRLDTDFWKMFKQDCPRF